MMLLVSSFIKQFKAASLTARLVVLGVVAVIVLRLAFTIAGLFYSSDKAAADLQAEQSNAALSSGRDAIETASERTSEEAEIDRTTQENRDAILNSAGADAPLDPALVTAGLRSLCKRAVNHSRAECMQLADPR